MYILSKKESALRKKIAVYFTDENTNLEEMVGRWEKKLARSPKTFIFDPRLPSPSSLLSAIGAQAPFDRTEILSFQYDLTSYPKLGGKSEDYQAKGELSLFLPLSLTPEALVQALLKIPFLNSEKKILWKEEKGIHIFTFYLNHESMASL